MLDTFLQDASQDLLAAPQLPLGQIVIRLLGALLLAGLIGFERERDGKPAGLRTHMLVSLASCVYTLIMLTLVDRAAGLGNHVATDPIRVVEAVTGGVAFLAAGMVICAVVAVSLGLSP